MDIDSYIKENAPEDDKHDRAYARALTSAYANYGGLNRHQLLGAQKRARERFCDGGMTHTASAACMIIYELLKELPLKVDPGDS